MLIEIKDLPTDRKIKQIKFDITFEDGSDCNEIADNKPNTITAVVATTESVNPIVNPTVPDTPRKSVPIPDEMTNLEL